MYSTSQRTIMCNVVPGQRGGLGLDKEEKAMGTLTAVGESTNRTHRGQVKPTATAPPSQPGERRARKHLLLVPAASHAAAVKISVDLLTLGASDNNG